MTEVLCFEGVKILLSQVSVLFVELADDVLLFVLLYLVETPSLEHQVLRCHQVGLVSSCVNLE